VRDLITVVLPAYNAAATLDETLGSVRAQTYEAMEIIVVDDGSTDATGLVAEAHAADDQRVRIIRTTNGGVGAARNAGVAAGSGDYIAPIDADDLWHPTKLERQVDAMRRSGPSVGLVYTWTALINDTGHVVALGPQDVDSGNVARRLWRRNLVGSGSCPLMRRRAVEIVGGYNESLHRQQAQGCEDWQLYVRISEQFEYAVVQEYLTGYRKWRGSMSSDQMRMYRSFRLAVAELLQRTRVSESDVREATANVVYTAYRQSLAAGQRDCARWFLRELLQQFPYQALKAFLVRPVRNWWRSALLGAPRPSAGLRVGQPFLANSSRSSWSPSTGHAPQAHRD
jgi:glycosyltransferase involved in cell wall biosynthesis